MDILDTSQAIRDFCSRAAATGLVGVDMEFERERTYRPVLQLVQASTHDAAVLIDPLAGADLTPVWELIADANVEKILHAGMQDMEITYNESGHVLPHAIFDTQIAAALVGLGEQPGYADVVRRLLGVHLKKGERTTDWSRRPLSKAQCSYALDDVVHLHALRESLLERLDELGRLDWLREEVLFYEKRAHYEKDPDELWLRVSRHRSLKGRQLAILRELALWREETAEQRNIPRLRVVADDVLVDLARRVPTTIDDLHQLRRLHHREIERGGEDILAAVQRGADMPAEEWPRLPKILDEDPELSVTVDLLATFVKYRAREVSIAPSYLGTKKEISAFAHAHRQGKTRERHALANGWRYELVGRELEEFLDGKLGLSVVPGQGRLKLFPV